MSPTTARLASHASLSSGEACEAAGITFRQLDYWCRSGVIVPDGVSTSWGEPCAAPADFPGSGRHRRFSAHQVAVLAACGELARIGADTPALGALVDATRTAALPVTVAIDARGEAHPGAVLDATLSPVLGACWVVTVEPWEPTP